MSHAEDRVEFSSTAAASGRERIMEILVFLLTEMRAKKALTEIDLQPLSQRGFSQTEISAAFSWLFDKLASDVAVSNGPVIFAEPLASRSVSSYRVYHEVERSVIGRDAQGYLMQMHELGLLNDFDYEFVIDRIMMSGIPSVSVEDIRDLVTGTVLGFDDAARQHSRIMLSASDKVQ